MTLKGKNFTSQDAPRSIRGTSKGEDWAAEQTERWAIVAHDDAGHPIVAEELQERALRTLTPPARIAATELLQRPESVRLEVLRAFDKHGVLRIPFKMV